MDMKRGENMGKQRAIQLKLNKRFVEKAFKTDLNIIKDGKNETEFEPDCIFTEDKPRWKFWRGTREIVLFVDGAVKALRFSRVTQNMAPFWNQDDERALIRREMKKSLASHKPMTWGQFVLLMIPIVAILLLALNLTFGGRMP